MYIKIIFKQNYKDILMRNDRKTYGIMEIIVETMRRRMVAWNKLVKMR